nr:putative protein N(5)-glutamine methyltransferase [Rhodococcus sp. HNM0569]
MRAAGCVYAEDEARLLVENARDAAHLERMAADRVSGTPIEYVLGYALFRSERIVVAPGVFVPRLRTEALVRAALPRLTPGDVVVEMCCGSAPVATALAREISGVIVHAADVDPVAIAVARTNLTGLGEVHAGDLFDALPRELRGRVDLLVANAPYVPSAHIALMPREAREHEHETALDGGPDGTRLQRAVAEGASGWLSPGGALLLETSATLADRTEAVVVDAGFRAHARAFRDLDAVVVEGVLRRTS